MKLPIIIVTIVLIFISCPLLSRANWDFSQLIELEPGWNSVFLKIELEDDDIESLLKRFPIERIRTWTPRRSTSQFIESANTTIAASPQWLDFYNRAVFPDEESTLYKLPGGRPYLIKLGGTEPVRWKAKGKPFYRTTTWVPNTFNFVGFFFWDAPSSEPPTFEQFFSSSSAHQPLQIKRKVRKGTVDDWEEVSSSERMNFKEAYQVYANEVSEFSGPFSVQFDQGSGIDFGKTLVEVKLQIKNHLKNSLGLRLDAGSGQVPLTYKAVHPETQKYEWLDFDKPLDLDLSPQERKTLNFAVNRHVLRTRGRKPISNGEYHSMMKVRTNTGFRMFIPVSTKSYLSESLSNPSVLASSSASATSSSDPVNPYTGLWVGTAKITHVSQPSNIDASTTPVPTSSDFQFRLILHVDAQGQTKLLQQVIQLWKNGTTVPAPDDATKNIVEQPGQFVLVTDESLLPNFLGSSVRQGKKVGKRISSAAFGFSSPVEMGMGFGERLSGVIASGHDDALNPFKHRYHPDHDNKNERFDEGVTLTEGKESFAVKRELALEFTDTDPEGLNNPGWQDTHFGGIYKEQITGIHRHPIHVQGNFLLRHVSRVSVLNDGIQ